MIWRTDCIKSTRDAFLKCRFPGPTTYLNISGEPQISFFFFFLNQASKKAEHRRTGAFELWCWRRLLRIPWTARRSNQSILKEISPFIGRTDVEAVTPILWPPDVKNWLIWKDPDAGKDLWWEEKGMADNEMVGWHHWCDGHEFEQALGVGDGREAWRAAKGVTWESDSTERLNWTEHAHTYILDRGVGKLQSMRLQKNWIQLGN